MKRAAVIIGVNKTGNLPQLQAAVTSAKGVYAWAKAQNFASIALLTDESQRLSVGQVKAEIKDPNAATAQYKAIYTAALTDSLNGLAPECLERVQENGNHVDLVRPWALKDHLDKELPQRMAAANVPITVFQLPDARITSPP